MNKSELRKYYFNKANKNVDWKGLYNFFKKEDKKLMKDEGINNINDFKKSLFNSYYKGCLIAQQLQQKEIDYITGKAKKEDLMVNPWTRRFLNEFNEKLKNEYSYISDVGTYFEKLSSNKKKWNEEKKEVFNLINTGECKTQKEAINYLVDNSKTELIRSELKSKNKEKIKTNILRALSRTK